MSFCTKSCLFNAFSLGLADMTSELLNIIFFAREEIKTLWTINQIDPPPPPDFNQIAPTQKNWIGLREFANLHLQIRLFRLFFAVTRYFPRTKSIFSLYFSFVRGCP